MTRLLIYFLLLCEVIVRYRRTDNGTHNRLQVLLVSVMIQSLMVYPILFSPLFKIEESGLDYFGAPFETSIGLFFPTIIAIIIMMISEKKLKWEIKEFKYPLFTTIGFVIFSYLTPYNVSYNATNIVVVLFFQICVVLYIIKNYLDYNQIIYALYDGLRIVIFIEFIVSLSYLLGFDALQNIFLNNIEEDEWIREGTNVRRAYGTTFQPNRLGGLCAFIGIFYVSCLLREYKKNESLIMAIMSFSVIIMSQSRSAIVAFGVACFFIFIVSYYKKFGLSLHIIFISLALLVLFVVMLNTSIVENMFFKSNVNEMQDARMAHYIGCWQIINDTHFIGVGLNSHVYYMYYKTNLTNLIGLWMATHAIHSVHLVLLAETGVVGLFCWLYFIVSRIIKFCKTPLQLMNNPIIWTTFAGMLIIVFIHGFTDCLYLHYQYLMLITLVGIFNQKKKINAVHKRLGFGYNTYL